MTESGEKQISDEELRDLRACVDSLTQRLQEVNWSAASIAYAIGVAREKVTCLRALLKLPPVKWK